MNNRRRAAILYLIAGLCFLIAGVVGLVGAEANGASMGFIVLSIVFLVLSLNARQSGRPHSGSKLR